MKKRPLAFFLGIFVSIVYGLMCLASSQLPDYQVHHKSTVNIQGKILDKNYQINSDKETVLVCLVKTTPKLNQLNKEKEIIQCTFPSDTDVFIGQTVLVNGKFYAPKEAMNPGEFDQKEYYAVNHIVGNLYDTKLIRASKKYSKGAEALFRTRKKLHDRIYLLYDETSASILATLILGEKKGLEEETKELYQTSGIIHILSISGLHISFLGIGLYKLLKRMRFPNTICVFMAELLLILYGIMVGMPVSAQRAIIMLSIQLLGKLINRTYDMLTGICVSGAVLVAVNPRILFYSGFLLSFAAVIGLALVLPLLAKQKGDKNIINPGLAMLMCSAPVQLSTFYTYSLYSMWLNLIVVPLVEPLMVASLLSIMISVVSIRIGGSLTYIVKLLLKLIGLLSGMSIRLPFSTLHPGMPNKILIVIYYFLLISLLILYPRIKRIDAHRIVIYGYSIILVLFLFAFSGEKKSMITMLHVGQGDGIYLQTKPGKCYMIDGGSSSIDKIDEKVIVPYLNYVGCREISVWFLTHPDDDHINGCLEILRKGTVKIGAIVLPRIAEDYQDEKYKEILRIAGSAGVNIYTMAKEDILDLGGGYKAIALNPDSSQGSTETNEYSLTLYVEGNGFSGLFTGDLTGLGEDYCTEYLQDKPPLTFLKVAHHGSNNSTYEDFLRSASPLSAGISCGKNNRYGHPGNELMERLKGTGCRIYETDVDGAVTFEISRGRCRVFTYK